MTFESSSHKYTRRDFLKKVGTGLTHFSLVNITVGGLSHFVFLNDSSAAEPTDNKTAWNDPNTLLGEECMLGDERAFSGECGMIAKNGCIFGDAEQQEQDSFFGDDGEQDGIFNLNSNSSESCTFCVTCLFCLACQTCLTCQLCVTCMACVTCMIFTDTVPPSP